MTNNIAVTGSAQVNLRVMVAEVSRQATKNFGFNWSAHSQQRHHRHRAAHRPRAGGGVRQFHSLAGAEQSSNSIGLGYRSTGGSVNVSGSDRCPAERRPHHRSRRAESDDDLRRAREFPGRRRIPVPVSQGMQEITIEWKRFGVSLDFTPTVLDGNRLSIKVAPEVSELSERGCRHASTASPVPGLSVRRADTTVELASGQSFAIAGLFQNNASNNVQQLPWLGDRAGPRRAVPVDAVPAQRKRARHHHHALHREAGCADGRSSSAYRRSRLRQRYRADAARPLDGREGQARRRAGGRFAAASVRPAGFLME